MKIKHEQYFNLFYDKSEKLEQKIAIELLKLSIDELNSFSREFNLDVKIISIELCCGGSIGTV